MQEEIKYIPIRKTRRKKHFADYIVYISLSAVVVYTITAFVLQFVVSIEPSPTLTTCFYSFFGVELASIALIKTTKVKKGSNMDVNANTDTKFSQQDHSVSTSRYEED